MKKIDERFVNFSNALDKVKDGTTIEASDLEVDGTLRRFKFTFELAWKLMKDYLEYNGIINGIASPRSIIQEAFQMGIIKDGDVWIEMMLDRNKLSHQYDEEKSREIYDNVKNKYIEQFEMLKEFLSTKV